MLVIAYLVINIKKALPILTIPHFLIIYYSFKKKLDHKLA